MSNDRPLPPFDPEHPHTEHTATGRRLVGARTALIGAGVALVVGGAIGAATAGPGDAEPRPAQTIIARGQDRVVVPDSCRDALDAADTAFGVTGEAFAETASVMGASADAVDAIIAGDLEALTAANDTVTAARQRLDALHAQLDVESYTTARDECRAAGR